MFHLWKRCSAKTRLLPSGGWNEQSTKETLERGYMVSSLHSMRRETRPVYQRGIKSIRERGMSKIKVLEFSEGVGMYTKGAKTLEDAVKAMREYALREQALDPESWSDNPNQGYDPNTVTAETVEQTWYYQCRRKDCGVGDTVGDDNTCFNCGELIGNGAGRRTFMFLVKS